MISDYCEEILEKQSVKKILERETERDMGEPVNEAMATVAEKAPVTAERKVPNDLETKLPKPCTYLLILFSPVICLIILEEEVDSFKSLFNS